MKKKLTFRLDDIAPGLRIENLKKFEEIFDQFDIKPIIGVVPCNKDPKLAYEAYDEKSFWQEVCRLQEKGWVIAQHGYEHVYSNKDSGLLDANPFSEFAGFTYEEQYEKIARGKAILEGHGLKTKMFMAPGHTFDKTTLKALDDNGFLYITDGYARLPYKRDNIIFIPCTLSGAKVPKGLDTVCIHLNYWEADDFRNLRDFLENNRGLIATVQEVLELGHIPDYNKKIMKQEAAFLKYKEKRNRMANDDKMQVYLQRSYSDNKVIKLIKRAIFLPMLLKK